MYRYAYVYKLSIISSSIEIILYNVIWIFTFPLYPYYQELINNLLLQRGEPSFAGRGWGGGVLV